jgi:hypothetical protein
MSDRYTSIRQSVGINSLNAGMLTSMRTVCPYCGIYRAVGIIRLYSCCYWVITISAFYIKKYKWACLNQRSKYR